MKRLIFIAIFGFILNSYALTEVCFSPSSCCEDNIIELANNSKKKIDIAIYSFTNQRIYNSLLLAKQRGVKIRIVTDKSQSKGTNSLITNLEEDGFNMRMKKKVRIEHNKFAIFDDKFIITGSYNWTKSATEANSENCLVDEREHIVKQYNKRFEELWQMYK